MVEMSTLMATAPATAPAADLGGGKCHQRKSLKTAACSDGPLIGHHMKS